MISTDFAGSLVRPDDAEYDTDRRVWNAMHDKRPALIAHCASVADVVAAVAHARAHDLELTSLSEVKHAASARVPRRDARS